VKIRPGRVALNVFAVLVIAFAVLPTVVVFPFAFNAQDYIGFPTGGWSTRWFESYFEDRTWTDATVQSLVVASLATLVSVVVGTLGALALVRRRMPAAGAIGTVLLFPMVAPPIVIAVGLYAFFSRLELVGTLPGLVLAHALLGTPFVFVNVSARLRTLDERLEQAAQSLGASPARTFLTVTVPTVAPAVVAGGLFAFLASWDEFIIAAFIAGVNGQTLPLRIFAGIRFEVDSTNAAVAAMLVSLVLLGLLINELLKMWTRRSRRTTAD
jgi:putative spermidine/putrescine transport system permease protein